MPDVVVMNVFKFSLHVVVPAAGLRHGKIVPGIELLLLVSIVFVPVRFAGVMNCVIVGAVVG